MSEPVLLRVEDGIAQLCLNRPEALNAYSIDMMESLYACLQTLQGRDDFAVVVIQGAGGHFMAGGDLKDFASLSGRGIADRQACYQRLLEDYVNPSVQMMQALPQPVVAQVQGVCVGFGLSLALGCDLIVCADDACFSTAYVGIGLPADGGMTHFLPRAVGSRKALELLLLADRFDAQQALAWGLVNRVVPVEELSSTTDALVQRLRLGPTRAFAELKRLFATTAHSDLTQQLQAEAEAFVRCSGSTDFVEGVEAFLAKRLPQFRGH